ncbi:MAG TPA: YceI family protein [Candidatus Binatia bacterium]|nr:YceI family protein [Candidatus Binatia bacterium]
MRRAFVIVLLATVAVGSAAAAESTWEIDPAHSSVQFSVRHMMVSNVRGEFRKVSGTVQGDETDPAKAKVEATIDTTSIDTRNEKRDTHLKSPDFLDTEKFPTMTFKSKKIEKTGDHRYRVTGDLTLHGVTREVALDVEGPSAAVKDPMGNLHVGATATAKINRQDFGITWSKALDGGGVMVGDDVDITIDVEGTKKK